jgi:hypothetical protein
MQETIKVIKEALNKNSNDLYELNQKKEDNVRMLVALQIDIYQKEDRQAKLQKELNEMHNLMSDKDDNASLKKADTRKERLTYNDECDKEKAR